MGAERISDSGNVVYLGKSSKKIDYQRVKEIDQITQSIEDPELRLKFLFALRDSYFYLFGQEFP